MKVFLDKRTLHIDVYKEMIEVFSDHEFIFELDDAYDCEVIISMPHYLDRQTLDKFKHLKWIQLISAGFNGIDLDYIKQRDILLTNAKDVYSIQIAEDVIAKILYLNKHMKFHQDNQNQGIWKYKSQHHELYSSTVGIVGTGSIGKHVAHLLKAFHTKVIGYKQTLEHIENFDMIYTKKEGLYKLLKESDYVIIAVPLSDHTKNLIDAHALSHMKASALLINVARGEVLDQEALVKALETHQIRGAGLDVTTPEPLPKDHVLWQLDNCYITPHNASASPMIEKRCMEKVKSTFEKVIRNKPLDNVIIK